jgi:isopentenyl-diphosphate Delta-isomerase
MFQNNLSNQLTIDPTIEQVVLVSDHDEVLGYTPKSQVHGANTALHRAFSCFIFNSHNQILLQQRSSQKKTWPLVWSNSVCGHPLPDESYENAVIRRAKFELGLDLKKVHLISPYQYCFTRFGVMENEICPIFVAFCDDLPKFNPDEIESIKYEDWNNWLEILRQDKKGEDGIWSEWCKEEAEIIQGKQSQIQEIKDSFYQENEQNSAN